MLSNMTRGNERMIIALLCIEVDLILWIIELENVARSNWNDQEQIIKLVARYFSTKYIQKLHACGRTCGSLVWHLLIFDCQADVNCRLSTATWAGTWQTRSRVSDSLGRHSLWHYKSCPWIWAIVARPCCSVAKRCQPDSRVWHLGQGNQRRKQYSLPLSRFPFLLASCVHAGIS